MTARKKVSCDIDEALAAQIKNRAQQEGRSQAEILREMIEQSLTPATPSLPASTSPSGLALNPETLLKQITTTLQNQLVSFAAQLPTADATDTQAILSELEYLGDRIANLEALFQTMMQPNPEPSPPLTPTAPRSIAATVLDFSDPPPPDLPQESPQPQPPEGLTLNELYEQTFLNPDLIRPMADYLDMTEAEFIEMRTGWRYDYISQRWYL